MEREIETPQKLPADNKSGAVAAAEPNRDTASGTVSPKSAPVSSKIGALTVAELGTDTISSKNGAVSPKRTAVGADLSGDTNTAQENPTANNNNVSLKPFTAAATKITLPVSPKTSGAVSPNLGAISPQSGSPSPRSGAVSPNTGAVSPKPGAVSPKSGSLSPKSGATSPKLGTTVSPKAGAGAVSPKSGALLYHSSRIRGGIPLPLDTVSNGGIVEPLRRHSNTDRVVPRNSRYFRKTASEGGQYTSACNTAQRQGAVFQRNLGTKLDSVRVQQQVQTKQRAILERSGAVSQDQSGSTAVVVQSGSDADLLTQLRGYVTIHVLLDKKRLEKILFSEEQDQRAIVEVFRSAAGAGPSDVIKLYDQSGRGVVITPRLQNEGRPYELQVFRYSSSNSELSQQLDLLQERVTSLERCLLPAKTDRQTNLAKTYPTNFTQNGLNFTQNLIHKCSESIRIEQKLLLSNQNLENTINADALNSNLSADSDSGVSLSVAKTNSSAPVDPSEQVRNLTEVSSANSVDTSTVVDTVNTALVAKTPEREPNTSEDDQIAKRLEMIGTRVQNLTGRAGELGAEWIGCGGRRCGGAYRDQLGVAASSVGRRRISLPRHTEVKAKFTQICDIGTPSVFSAEALSCLRLPVFDSYAWSDDQLLLLLHTMFTSLELTTRFHIADRTLRAFLYEVYKHYNEVPFHNFRHCFCVAQMMYAMAWRVDLVSRLGHLEVLVLLVSCICHDLDHPGYNNIYQINARTELAIRYNDISPLENHHCSVAFRILELPECNILEGLSPDVYRQVREGIIRCILATDMARHNEILAQFRDITPEFDYDNRTHTNLLQMVLIKVADISNEARPIDVAEPWLDRLLQEFFAQSAAEKQEGLPVTPFMDPDKVSKPSSQVRFIGLVLLPLFEALGDHMPELQDLIVQPVRDALEYYRRLNEATREGRSRKSLADGLEGGQTPPLSASHSTHSVRSRRSLGPSRLSLSISRSIDDEQSPSGDTKHDSAGNLHEDEQGATAAGENNEQIHSEDDIEEGEELEQGEGEGDEEQDEEGEEGEESGDSETATEVEVSEKTLKFKIATEGGSISGDRRNSRIGLYSRKNSHDRCLQQQQLGGYCCGGGSLDQQQQLQQLRYERRSSLGPSSSGGSIGNHSSCGSSTADRCCRARNSDGSVRSPCSESCRTGSHSVRQISEEGEPPPDVQTNTTKITTTNITTSNQSQKKNNTQDAANIGTKKPQENANYDEIIIDKTYPQTTTHETDIKSEENGNSKSIFARLKQFTDRISMSFDKQMNRNNNSNSLDMTSTSPGLKTSKLKKEISVCCEPVSEPDDTLCENKASTLPKTKKVDMKRTWRLLMNNKERTTTSSMDTLTNVDKPTILIENTEAPNKTQNNLQSLVGNRDRVEI